MNNDFHSKFISLRKLFFPITLYSCYNEIGIFRVTVAVRETDLSYDKWPKGFDWEDDVIEVYRIMRSEDRMTKEELVTLSKCRKLEICTETVFVKGNKREYFAQYIINLCNAATACCEGNQNK